MFAMRRVEPLEQCQLENCALLLDRIGRNLKGLRLKHDIESNAAADERGKFENCGTDLKPSFKFTFSTNDVV